LSSQINSSYTVASVDRALQLLLLLGRATKDMGVTEISKVLGVQKSTTHSLLQTLMGRGFVQQNENGRYALGVRLIELGQVCKDKLDVREAARPLMLELANETRQIALLAVLARNELIIVEKVEPERPFLIIPKFDFSVAVHSTAVGKVLMANAPDEIIDKIISSGLEKYTDFTLTDREALLNELEAVRQQGYGMGCNETINGVTCLAVPIFDNSRKVMAALSVSCPSSILSNKDYMEIIQILKQKAGIISQRLGYRLL